MLYGMSSVYGGWANNSVLASDGGVTIGGNTYPPSGIQQAAIIRYAANGDSLWLREYGHEDDSWLGRQVNRTKDGGYILAGEAADASGDFVEAFLVKTDNVGNVQWQRTYGGANPTCNAISVDTTAAEGYFVGGQFRVAANNQDLWVFRVDGDGDTVWSRHWGTSFNEPAAHLTTLSNGNPIIASATGNVSNDYAARMYQAELDQFDGHFVWQRYYGPLAVAGLTTAKEVRPGLGTIAAGGYEEPDSVGYLKGVLLRTAPGGDSLWMRTYVYYDSLINDGIGIFRDVIPTPDNGFIACGMTHGCYDFANCPPGYGQDVWVVKVDSMGCLVPGCDDFSTAITVQATNLRDALSVFPNPAHGGTVAKVTLPAGSPFANDLRLRLVSAQGQEVLVQKAALGENQVTLRGLAAGVCYLHLTSGSTWLGGAKLIIE